MDIAASILSPELTFGSGAGVFLVVLVVLLSIVSVNDQQKKNKLAGLPPGPHGLPIVGYLPFMTLRPGEHFFHNLRKKYGDVIRIKVGTEPIVILNSAKAVKENLNKPGFLGRSGHLFDALIPGSDGAFAWNGEKWKEQRLFTNQVFKDLGVGRSKQHQEFEEESVYFTKILERYEGKPLDVNDLLKFFITNNLHALLIGKRFSYDDQKAIAFNKLMDELFNNAGDVFTIVFFPWLKNLPYFRSIKKPEKLKIVVDFVKEQVAEHKRSLDPQNLQDYTDRHLEEAQLRIKKNPNTFITDEALIDVLIQIYIAGTESVRTTLGWCLYTMAAMPEVQEKVHKCIDEVIGTARTPTYEDQKNLPYIQAILMEVQRWKTVSPLGVPRMTVADTDANGYFIPKGTFVIANLFAVHHDPEYWTKPYDFIPERFLCPDGKIDLKNEYYMPFSFGRRDCVGQKMATAELFIAFTCILQKFTIKPPEGTKLDFAAYGGLIFHLKKNVIRFIKRNKDEE